jgi:hypothetical protein
MANGKLTKDRQYHGQREAAKDSQYHSFPLAMLLAVFCQFPFGLDIGCLLSVSLWP